MYIFLYSERRLTTVDTRTKLIMLRECVLIVITGSEESKNLGNVLIKSCMRLECAKIVI